MTSYFEWLGAGEYAVDHRQGAMHGGRSGLQMLRYGTDGERLFLRLDFDPLPQWGALEIRVKSADNEVRLSPGEYASGRVAEAGVPFAAAFQVSLWLDGIPVESLPVDGWLHVEMPKANWRV